MQQAFLNLRRGHPGPLPAPVDDLGTVATPEEQAMVNHALRISAVGGPDRVAKQIETLIARYRPDEVIFAGGIHDHAMRLRSFEIGAQVMAGLAQAA